MMRIGLEALLLVGLGAAVGLAFNATRSKQIDLGRDYFGKPMPSQPSQRPTVIPSDERTALPAATAPDDDVTKSVPAVVEEFDLDGFKAIAVEDVEYYSRVADSSVLIIDARNDAHYEQAHIPNAVQFDPYFPDGYLDPILMMAPSAQTIIIYCGGGKCTDSVMAAQYLTGTATPPLDFNRIHIYEGGINEWCGMSLPVIGECVINE